MNTLPIIAFITSYYLVSKIGIEGWFNYASEPPEIWYARSGALLVSISIIGEIYFRRRVDAVRENEKLTKKYVKMLADVDKVSIIRKIALHVKVFTYMFFEIPISPPYQKFVKVSVDMFLIWGTFVWGYGDLIYSTIASINMGNILAE
jgi:hypothetical protein